MIRFATLSLLCALPALPAQPYFNVQLDPYGSYAWIGDQLAVVRPGGGIIAKFHNMTYMPPGTFEVEMQPVAFAVYETNACAVGSGIFYDGSGNYGPPPVSTVPHLGWSMHQGYSAQSQYWWFTAPHRSSYMFDEIWFLTYCGYLCLNRCATAGIAAGARDPQYEIHLLAVRFM